MQYKPLLTAIALAAVLAAPAHAATLRWAAQNDILTLDPHSQNHATTNAILMHAYEGLTRYSDKYQVEPALATKWTYLSPTQVRFELRKGVKFHDGSDFSADDVLFSFDRIRQPQGTMQIYVTGIKEIKKVDSHTVDFILSAPNPILLRNIIDFRMMSKTWAEKNNSAKVQDYKANEENFASRNVNGTGAYRILNWTPEQRVMMARHEGWWDKVKGNVEQVVYTPIKSDATRVAALLSGDVDMLTDLPTQDVARLRADKKLKVVDGPEVRTIYLAPDMGSAELKYSNVKGKNPFADKRVRQALSMAIDREAIKRTIMRGLSIPAGVMVAPGVNGNSKDIDVPMKADAAAARKLLADAGYANGFEVRLNCPNNRYVNDEKICQAIAAMWAKIGVKVNLNAESMATFIQKVQKFDSSIYLLGWGVPTFDSAYVFNFLVHGREEGYGSYNGARYDNPEVNAMIESLATMTDLDARDATIAQIWDKVMEDRVFLNVHNQLLAYAVRDGINLPVHPENQPSMADVTFTR